MKVDVENQLYLINILQSGIKMLLLALFIVLKFELKDGFL
jgi:hypothetical protein